MDALATYSATHTTREGSREEKLHLVPEEPLAIHVQGRPYAAVARTPGDDDELIAGMCFADGLIDGVEDFASRAFFPSADRNLAQVQLTGARHAKVLPFLQDWASLRMPLPAPGPDRAPDPILSLDDALRLADILSRHQSLRALTVATHGVALFDGDLELLSVREDLGRHNAFDKAIGDLVLRSRTIEARVAVLSSRVASELVHKALRLGVSSVLSVSRPTEAALLLARQGNLRLACLSRAGGYYTFR